MHFSATTRFALDAVARACRAAERVKREMVSPSLTKDDRSPVTVGDFASQAIVASLLQEHLPGQALVAEENAQRLREPEQEAILEQVTRFAATEIEVDNSETVCQLIDVGTAAAEGRYWTLDPIDGTKGFLRGDQYAVCLALIDQGKVELGVMGCPHLNAQGQVDTSGQGAIYLAERGGGAWVAPLPEVYAGSATWRQIHVSQRDVIRQARLLRSFESGHTDAGKVEEFVTDGAIEAEPVRMDSQAKFAVLATGGGELLLRLLSPSRPDYREKIWDQAAGMIVVEEAGGRVTDLDGKPLDFRQGRTLSANRGVLACNGHLHQAALEGLRRIGA